MEKKVRMFRIDTLNPNDVTKLRNRSIQAINGLKLCLQHTEEIANMKTIGEKYKTIAEYMGLSQEGGNSYYNYYIPLNKKILFLLRNGNHNNTNPDLYNMHEKLGRPNKRYVIYFKKGNVFSDNSVTFLDAEHHTVTYDVNALDEKASVVAYINSLIELFTDGETTFPPLPIMKATSDASLELSSRQYPKSLIRLTESDLYEIIMESVRRLIKKVL